MTIIFFKTNTPDSSESFTVLYYKTTCQLRNNLPSNTTTELTISINTTSNSLPANCTLTVGRSFGYAQRLPDLSLG